MSNEVNEDFEKSDIILANALEEFQAQGVNQYVYGMALVEIGLLALVKLAKKKTNWSKQFANSLKNHKTKWHHQCHRHANR